MVWMTYFTAATMLLGLAVSDALNDWHLVRRRTDGDAMPGYMFVPRVGPHRAWYTHMGLVLGLCANVIVAWCGVRYLHARLEERQPRQQRHGRVPHHHRRRPRALDLRAVRLAHCFAQTRRAGAPSSSPATAA